MTTLSEAILKNTTGLSLVLHDPEIVRLVAPQVDFFVLDLATRPAMIDTVETLFLAANGKPFLIRPENSQPATLQRYLALGIDGLVLSDIHFAAEAERAFAACLYPPEGIRPYRPFALKHDQQISLGAINDQLTLVLEIAHPQAVAQINELAEVTGLNGVVVNPKRLAVAMEKAGEGANHPAVQDAIAHVINAARAYELPFGLEASDTLDPAVHFTIIASDFDLLRYGLEMLPKQDRPDEDASFEEEFVGLRAVR